MNKNFFGFLLNVYILIGIFLLITNLSVIICKKNIGSRNVKTQTRSQPIVNPKYSQRAPYRTSTFNDTEDQKFVLTSADTTISRKIAAHAMATGFGWHYGYEVCAGRQQSPIRLVTSTAETNRSLHMTFKNYNKLVKGAFIENNGHTVQIGFKDIFKASVYGTATNNRRFIFAQLHFHWGSVDGVGSEHTVDGYRGPMEMHLVHYNNKYGNLDNAVNQSDGLMVLGILFKSSSQKNQFLTQVMDLVSKVPNYKDKVSMRRPFALKQLLPKRKRPFFIYSGSLNTPPCYESVQWLVFKRPVLLGDVKVIHKETAHIIREKHHKKVHNKGYTQHNDTE